MDKRWKKRVGRLNIQNPPQKLKSIRYYDENGIIRETIHDGSFSPAPATPTVDYMYFEAAQANSTVSMMSTLETAPNLEYSTDGETWQEWGHTTVDGVHVFDTITLGAVGDKVYFRGDNPNGLSAIDIGAQQQNISSFALTGAINGGGNIMSLLDTTMALNEVPQFGFVGLFAVIGADQGSALLTPPSMDSITSIGSFGCTSMFYGCTSITSAADMPSLLTVGAVGCAAMYAGCTSLTTAADMPNVTTIGASGFDGTYSDCTFLMSDDGGKTLNFGFPALPITAGETTYSTPLEIGQWIGNTNGFTNP